jgi:hypothetical protein
MPHAAGDTGAIAWTNAVDAGLAGKLDSTVASSTFLAYSGTDPAHIPVSKPLGDVRSANWEFAHDDTNGYLFHLLCGPNMGQPAALIGMGIDNDGIGLFVNNKTAGIGVRISQNDTITSATAVGLQILHASHLAPGMQVIVSDAATDAIQIQAATITSATQAVLSLITPLGVSGLIYAKTGELHWQADIVTHDGGIFRARELDGGSDNNQIKVKSGEVQFCGSTGVSGDFYHHRITHSAYSLKFDCADAASGGPDAAPTYVTALEIGRQGGWQNKIGFFGVAPALQPAHPATLADVIAALTTLGLTA